MSWIPQALAFDQAEQCQLELKAGVECATDRIENTKVAAAAAAATGMSAAAAAQRLVVSTRFRLVVGAAADIPVAEWETFAEAPLPLNPLPLNPPTLTQQPPSSWSAGDVGAWLAGIGGAYSGYSVAFIENGIEGGELLSEDFGQEELMEMGVASTMHQRRIVKEIKKLK
jgi:hypothetical protein